MRQIAVREPQESHRASCAFATAKWAKITTTDREARRNIQDEMDWMIPEVMLWVQTPITHYHLQIRPGVSTPSAIGHLEPYMVRRKNIGPIDTVVAERWPHMSLRDLRRVVDCHHCQDFLTNVLHREIEAQGREGMNQKQRSKLERLRVKYAAEELAKNQREDADTPYVPSER